MKRGLLVLAGSVCLLWLAGCDNRSTAEKLYNPSPDYTTRQIMACPKCGAPQKPYRINGTKEYYECSGMPPRFPYHPRYEWSHTIETDKGEQ